MGFNIDDETRKVDERKELLELAKRMRDSAADYEGDHPLSLTGHNPLIYALGVRLAANSSGAGRELILSESRVRELLEYAARLQREELDGVIAILEKQEKADG